MHTRIVTALKDSHGKDISGNYVPMPEGSQHVVSEFDVPWFLAHPDVFSVGEAYQTRGAALSADLNALGDVPRWSPSGALVGVDGIPLPVEYSIAQNATGKILPACAAGTTVSQSGGTVTVVNAGASPAAHNIPATTFDGLQVYFPGSPTIAAGWYPGFVRTSTTAYTFTRASATVASESVNAGAEYITETTFETVTIPGGSMGPNGVVTALLEHNYNNSAGTKLIKLKTPSNNNVASNSGTTTLFGRTMGFMRNRGSENSQFICTPNTSFTNASTAGVNGAIDTTAAVVLTLTGTLAAANDYMVKQAICVTVCYGG